MCLALVSSFQMLAVAVTLLLAHKHSVQNDHLDVNYYCILAYRVIVRHTYMYIQGVDKVRKHYNIDKLAELNFVSALVLCHHYIHVHQDNMSVCFIPPYTPLLYSKIGVYTGIHNFLIFALKHRLWVLIRTASLRRF